MSTRQQLHDNSTTTTSCSRKPFWETSLKPPNAPDSRPLSLIVQWFALRSRRVTCCVLDLQMFLEARDQLATTHSSTYSYIGHCTRLTTLCLSSVLLRPERVRGGVCRARSSVRLERHTGGSAIHASSGKRGVLELLKFWLDCVLISLDLESIQVMSWGKGPVRESCTASQR